jgi:hypothetical protein
VTAYVHKARSPDVPLDGAQVYLLEELPEDGASEPTGRFAVMVDDPWWGRRIQPAQCALAPLTEDLTMGYRLHGRLLEDGEPAAGENVSLELELTGVQDERVVLWDSVEHNELTWDAQRETYVEGPTVLAPIVTDAEGRWEWLAPKGHGAIYQRAADLRDETPETAARGFTRHLVAVRQAWRGRMAEVVEGAESVLDILSGTLEISAEPGATLRVGTLDDPGTAHTVPPGGTVTITGLPEAEHSIVAFRLTAWGTWDQSFGCARRLAQVRRGETTSVQMGPLEEYTDPDMICGRVYERPGVPAAGVEIVVIDTVACELIGTLTTTDGSGWWEAEVPPEGLGGQPAIHDERRGSLPVLGTPYSDVVLGARVYSAAYESYKPEAWRRPLRGHRNFQYVPGSVTVENAATGEQFSTVQTAFGGWITSETLPKFRHEPDIERLVWWGAEAHSYRILVDGEDRLPQFELRGQPFDDTGSGAGVYRAAGYYPEQKILMGGKIHGSVVRGARERIGANLPEAARVGLEFGEHEAFTEARALSGGAARAGVADTVCPYCGGPAWRDPDGARLRGFCMQCAEAFGRADAMDCRTHFTTPTLARTDGGHAMRLVRVSERDGSRARRVNAHWRPDLYDETEQFVTQSGAGQTTNAPRWVARHVNELGDGAGFGSFDGDASEPWTPGHDAGVLRGAAGDRSGAGGLRAEAGLPAGVHDAADVHRRGGLCARGRADRDADGDGRGGDERAGRRRPVRRRGAGGGAGEAGRGGGRLPVAGGGALPRGGGGAAGGASERAGLPLHDRQRHAVACPGGGCAGARRGRDAGGAAARGGVGEPASAGRRGGAGVPLLRARGRCVCARSSRAAGRLDGGTAADRGRRRG